MIAAFHTLGTVEEQQVSTGALKGLHGGRFWVGEGGHWNQSVKITGDDRVGASSVKGADTL